MGPDRLNRLVAGMVDDGVLTYAPDDSKGELLELVVCDADQ